MTDPISHFGRMAQMDSNVRQAAKTEKRPAADQAAAAQSGSSAAARPRRVTAPPLPATGERAHPRVAVFTDKLDWHVDETLKAFRALGARPVAVRLSACRIDTSRPHGLAIPGFHDLPDLAVVRAIGDGTERRASPRTTSTQTTVLSSKCKQSTSSPAQVSAYC